MIFPQVAVVVSLAVAGTAGNAPEVADSPAGASAIATFPSGGSQSVSGSVGFAAQSDGQVKVSVNVSGLPTSGGPFLYHIHVNPVPSSGNCTAAAGHLNPFAAPESCAASDPSSCEVGDLSGKWGTANTTSFSTSYVDPYLSLNTSDKAFIAQDRSIVIHYHNTSRIACANLKYTAAANATTNTTSPNSIPSAAPVSDNAASSFGVPGLAVAAAAILAPALI